jgi:hypothetical protein
MTKVTETSYGYMYDGDGAVVDVDARGSCDVLNRERYAFDH